MPVNTIHKEICERINQLFKAGGGSQEEVSAALGIQRTQFGRIIKGKLNPTLQQVCAIASHYGVGAGWIIEGDKEKSGPLQEPDIDLLTLMKKQSDDLKANFDRLFSQLSAQTSGKHIQDEDVFLDLTGGKKKAGKQ